MNKDRRKRLCKIIEQADELLEQLQAIEEEEQTALDNTPESLQLTDRYADMEMAVEAMAEAADSLTVIINGLEGIL